MTGRTTLAGADAEWAAELTRSWLEVHKKSATTVVLLRIVREHGPVAAGRIAPLLAERTGWSVTERGLYRTLRRLAEAGVLVATEVAAARTGARRRDFSLTAVGAAHLDGIEAELAREHGGVG